MPAKASCERSAASTAQAGAGRGARATDHRRDLLGRSPWAASTTIRRSWPPSVASASYRISSRSPSRTASSGEATRRCRRGRHRFRRDRVAASAADRQAPSDPEEPSARIEGRMPDLDLCGEPTKHSETNRRPRRGRRPLPMSRPRRAGACVGNAISRVVGPSVWPAAVRSLPRTWVVGPSSSPDLSPFVRSSLSGRLERWAKAVDGASAARRIGGRPPYSGDAGAQERRRSSTTGAMRATQQRVLGAARVQAVARDERPIAGGPATGRLSTHAISGRPRAPPSWR